ncbi:hypothetical protein C0J52_14837 [Blattella germanica]|nr:hypothetical protein C0J52_14837 [Blattella germanica]
MSNLLAGCCGMMVSWPSSVIPLLKSNTTTIIEEKITHFDESWLASLIYVTAMASSPIYCYLNQNFGRKTAGYFCGTAAVTGCILMIFARSLLYFYIGRILHGITFGGTTAFLSLYISEISEDNIRGTLGVTRGIFFNAGILLMIGIGPFSSITLIGYISFSLPLTYLVFFHWFPESPMFLLGKGKDEEAYKSYKWLRMGDEQVAQEEMSKLRTVVQSKMKKMPLLELISVRGNRKAMIIGAMLTIFRQLSGATVVLTYTTRFFILSGTSVSPAVASMIVAGANLLGSISSFCLIDLAGRKFLLISSQTINVLSFGALGLYLYMKEMNFDMSAPGLGLFPVICICTYAFFCSGGLSTLSSVIMAEIFRPEIRGLAVSVLYLNKYLWTFVSISCHLFLEHKIGLFGTFWFYGGISLVGSIFVYFIVPETKNKSLETILDELNGKPLKEETNIVVANVGMVLSWPSPAFELLRESGRELSAEHESWLAALVQLTALLSSPLFSYTIQNLGRKCSGYITGVSALVGWILITAGDSLPFYYAGRALQGVALGGMTMFVPLYVGEIAEDSIRGTLGATRAVMMNSGSMLMFCIGPYLSVQNLGIVSLSLPVVYLVLFYWLPESPMHLLGKGKEEEALKVYKWLRRDDEKAEEEMKKLRLVVNTSTEKIPLVDTIKARGTRNALIIAFTLSVVTVYSGLAIVISFTTKLFRLSGSSIPPAIATMILGGINIIGSLVTMILTDLAGRRFILISTLITQGIALIGLGTYIYLSKNGFDLSYPGLGLIPVVCLSVYSFCSVAGVLTMTVVITAEILRPEVRGIGMSVISITMYLLSFVSVKTHHNLEVGMGLHGCFWFYGSVSVVGCIFVFFRLPETKNRTIESILRELNGDPLREGESVPNVNT